MRVKELMAELANFPEDREVWLGYEYGLLGRKISVSAEIVHVVPENDGRGTVEGHRLIEDGDNPKPEDERRIVVIWEDIDAED